MALNLQPRTAPEADIATLLEAETPALLARLYAARGIKTPAQLSTALTDLIAPNRMKNLERMATLLADAITAQKKLLIVADYDVDGATACAVGLRALRAFHANVDYLVPNRFEYGYGLTPEIAELAKRVKNPDVIITVDNGIASVEGVAKAHALGMQVLVTDHHLPGATLPDALCIINPNQPGCEFPSKNLAGVGVMFYLMLALRTELRKRDAFKDKTEPNLSALLDLVALGTVADVVKLDDNNRILVAQGLQRIRDGKTWPGIAALLKVAGRNAARATTFDLGFAVGPRLNAAGRLSDMGLGIECLSTDDESRALQIAQELDALNRERRTIESQMQNEALAALAALENISVQDGNSISLYNAGWHQGVIGILASRLKDKFHKPAFVFAPANIEKPDGEIKGSGRSIKTLHLRDALDLVDKRAPGLLLKFGGHAAAAGLTLRADDFEKFRAAFEEVAQTLLTPADLARAIETDGSLPAEDATYETALSLEQAIWGQGFPAPVFDDIFTVTQQRIVGDRHLKLQLKRNGNNYEGIIFGYAGELPAEIRAVYRLGVNAFQGQRSAQLVIEHWQPEG